MRTAPPRLLGAVLALAAAALISGCGKSEPVHSASAGPSEKLAPVLSPGAVSISTRNTTRLGGADEISDAAAVARTVYPAMTFATRPQAVVLVNQDDWPAALAASVLSSSPLGAPLLYSEGESLPAISAQTLQALNPLGASTLGGAQAIRVATSAPLPAGYATRTIPRGEPAVVAGAVARLLLAADGAAPPHAVIVLAANTPPALAMPAAGLAAESGAPILFVTRARVPLATAAALTSLHRPSIYVIGSAQVGAATIARLARFGRVVPITSGEPPVPAGAVAGAIAVARFTYGSFGWAVKEPGHGLVFANLTRPLDAPAAALLSATGDYGPLLLLESATQIPPQLAGYLGDIQPAYTASIPAVRGVYNHGWLIGDEHAISIVTQSELDSLLEITERKAGGGEEGAPAPVE